MGSSRMKRLMVGAAAGGLSCEWGAACLRGRAGEGRSQDPARLMVTVAGPRRGGEGGSWRTGVPQPGGRGTFCFICKAFTKQPRANPEASMSLLTWLEHADGRRRGSASCWTLVGDTLISQAESAEVLDGVSTVRTPQH